MVWWQYVLFPFAVLYDLITRMRNRLYDRGTYPTVQYDTAKVISVGNLAVGGTGKSPMVDYLIRALLPHYRVSTLSRGYGRNTSGFRLASDHESAATIGDEPFMYYLNHGSQVPVSVGEDRVLAIAELLGWHGETEVVLLDDAFQHRAVQPHFQILLTTWQRPFFADWLMPAGRLREARKGAARADVVVVTKCPAHLSEAEMVKLRSQIQIYTDAPVFFTTVTYGTPVSFWNTEATWAGGRSFAVSGIANPELFNQHVRERYQTELVHNYGDHHRYTSEDLSDLLTELKDKQLITTEKDMVKLRDFAELQEKPCFYIPIRVRFLKDESLFLQLIHSVIKNDVPARD